MNSAIWRSPDVSFVERLSYDGHHVGTKTIFKDGRNIVDILYPDIQAIVFASPGFRSWLEDCHLICHERCLSELEYIEMLNRQTEYLSVDDLFADI